MSIKNKNKLNKYCKKSTNCSIESGFTIVELLVVITIIGILATIIILFYIGTHQKAIDTALQSDLKGASTQLELDRVSSELYPTNIGAANNGNGLKASPDTAFNYIPANGDATYCLEASREGRIWYIDSTTKIPIRGTCAGGPADDGGGGSIAGTSYMKTWGGTDFDYGLSMAKTSDGGYVIVGRTYSFGTGSSQNSFITKFTADGTMSWSKAWGGNSDDEVRSVIQTSDGGYAVSGQTFSYGAGFIDAFVAKFAADGTMSWNKTWGSTDGESADSIAQTSDGGYIVTGYTNSFGYADGDAILVKLTTNGDVSWSKAWNMLLGDGGNSVIQTSDGGYAVVGTSNVHGMSNENMTFIAKFGTDGSMSWNRIWNESPQNNGQDIVQANDGGLVITGSISDPYSGSYVAKFSIDGDLIWGRAIDDGWPNSIIKTSDGGYAVSGGTYNNGARSSDSYLAKFTAGGELSWNKAWGGSAQDFNSALFQTDDGGYVMSGVTANFGVAGGGDVYMIKYKSDGSITDCNAPTCRNPIINTASFSPTANSLSVTVNTINTATANQDTSTSNVTTSITATATPEPPEPEPEPIPEMTATFSSQELYVAYPGESQTSCKEWTVPEGSTIKGFKLSQATESGWDYFKVSLDGVEIYSNAGTFNDVYTDTSATPGTTITACLTTDSSTQDGFGGEVTGVIYN